MKKQYFFGYLFARSAKALVLLVMSIAAGFCVLEYSQANTSASATVYQPSTALHRALTNLTDAFAATNQIVTAFDADHQLTTAQFQPPRFPTLVESNSDFAAVDEALRSVDRQRLLMKHSIVSRFEILVQGIEGKLRAYAASMGASGASASPTSAPSPNAAPPPKTVSISTQPGGSLFSSRLGSADVNKRSADLNARKEFLKVLETKAENPENRVSLTEAVAQLETLGKLLPEQQETAAQPESATAAAANDPGRKVLPAERVAAQLEQLRGEVRQIFLTSWSLDEMFEQATDLNSVERDKCRVAGLAQKGIWLSTMSRILVALLVAILASFVILVCADLVKTFLDTASHTGVVADAINAMRGATIIAKNQVRQPWPRSGSDIADN